tara:strand:+ start:9511 stop:10488 length:978 start_codon:yes stop_codon:yes gene_type:complete
VIKRTIEISREPTHLAVRDNQLLILRKSEQDSRRLPARPPNLSGTIPCEDIGVVMVDHRQTTYSHHTLIKLAEHEAALVICGQDHHPVGMYLPLSKNTHLLSRLDAQLNASKPTKKRLWQQIVTAKVRAQADALFPLRSESAQNAKIKLEALSRRVRSGDPENIESQAAAVYWKVFFHDCPDITKPFRRKPGDRTASPPNNLLDYGYSAIRAAVARSIVSSGLLPAVGVKHIGRSNPFCLADDLMEPLRPLVDRRARWLAMRGELELSQANKAELLEVLTEEVAFEDQTGPLFVVIARYVSGFVHVLTGESKDLSYPQSVGETGT